MNTATMKYFTDLAAEKPELVAKAKALFESARTESADWPIKDRPAAAPGKGAKY